MHIGSDNHPCRWNAATWTLRSPQWNVIGPCRAKLTEHASRSTRYWNVRRPSCSAKAASGNIRGYLVKILHSLVISSDFIPYWSQLFFDSLESCFHVTMKSCKIHVHHFSDDCCEFNYQRIWWWYTFILWCIFRAGWTVLIWWCRVPICLVVKIVIRWLSFMWKLSKIPILHVWRKKFFWLDIC